MLASWKKSYAQHRKHIKKQRHYFAIKGPSSRSYDFSSGHVWMWELDHKESWAPKNWCFWTVMLEKTPESSMDCKEIQPVNPEGNQFWILIGRTDADVEMPIFWPPDAKKWHWKRPWYWERLKVEGEGDNRGWDGWMASPTEWTWVWAALGVGEGQGGLECCSRWGRKELDVTERLNWSIILFHRRKLVREDKWLAQSNLIQMPGFRPTPGPGILLFP